MTVLITGATGLVGQEVVKRCHRKGITVHYLTTSKSKLSNTTDYKGFFWNPNEGVIDTDCFEGVDAIINLVGASISKRWTRSYKTEILESRTDTATLLAETIKAHQFPVKYIVSASAIGVYPSSLVNYYEEDSTEISSTFLGEVVEAWEAAVDDFSELDIEVCKIRIGLVLSNQGGAFPKIVQPIRYGVGAAFGSGKQWQSWIHLEDLAAIFIHALNNNLTGIYNAVAPNPVTNNELTKTTAKAVKRPLILPNIPKTVMNLMLGEMHILLFESQRVSSKKIEDMGYEFTFHHLEPAIEDLV